MPNDIVSSRVVHAPRELVWKAYTDPIHLARWWGPKGFTNTFEQFDLRPEGDWRFLMHGPNGADYPNHSRFVEITPPERLAFRHLGSMHAFDVVIDLAARGLRTQVTFRMAFDDAEEAERVKMYVVPANEENFDRLEAELWEMA